MVAPSLLGIIVIIVIVLGLLGLAWVSSLRDKDE